MNTTTLKLSESLKARTAQAARELGLSPHAFMVAAIEQAATLTEQRIQFLAQAGDARKEALATDLGFEADEVHAYLRARAAGQMAPRPAPRAWRA